MSWQISIINSNDLGSVNCSFQIVLRVLWLVHLTYFQPTYFGGIFPLTYLDYS